MRGTGASNINSKTNTRGVTGDMAAVPENAEEEASVPESEQTLRRKKAEKAESSEDDELGRDREEAIDLETVSSQRNTPAKQ